MSESASIAEAARYFDVSEESIRRWIRQGCPCVSPGEKGRGNGARLNLDDVANWRASRVGITGSHQANVMERVEQALMDAARRDAGNGKPIAKELGISGEQAARFLVEIHRRISRALNGGG